jgi:hypothetical protein
MYFPTVPEKHVTSATKPRLVFDCLLSSYDRGNRQCFLSFSKLLRESARVLTMGFVLICKEKWSGDPYEGIIVDEDFSISQKLGPNHLQNGDCGRCFEDLMFGGRIRPCADSGCRPFTHELEIINLPFREFPPTKIGGNWLRKSISDSFLSQFFLSLDSWIKISLSPFRTYKFMLLHRIGMFRMTSR